MAVEDMWKSNIARRGMPPTRKLFKQFNDEGTEDLDEWRKIFVEASDPTEYQAALLLVGSWKEWCRFKKDWKAFNDIVDDWVQEVEIKIRSEAIRDLAQSGEASAQKWIAEGRYKQRTAGKPTKAQVERAARIEAGIEKETDEEVDRVLNVVSINGTKQETA